MSRMGRRRASLRGLLVRLVLVLALVLGGLISVAVIGTVTTSRDYRDASERAIGRQGAANRFLITMLNAQSLNRAYILLARGVDLQAWNQARDRFEGDLESLRAALAGEEELLASADAVERTSELWEREAVELIRLRRTGDPEEAIRRVDTGPGEARFNAFRTEHRLLLDRVEEQRMADLAQSDRTRRLVLGGIGGAALLALVVVAMVSRQVWIRVKVPVDRVEAGVTRVTMGRLSDPVAINDDAVRELAALAQGFNQMQREVLEEREAVLRSARRDEAQRTERQLWETVQKGLLPSRLPSPPGYRLTARYRSADRELLVGGDFYDGKVLPDGSLAIMVGDMAGHGAGAAAQAAGLRFGWRTLMSVDPEPGAVMAGLNAQMGSPEQRSDGIFASVIHVLVRPDGELRFAVAGHPPPLLLTPGRCRVLTPAAPGPLLGVFDHAEWPVTRGMLPRGGTLFLYTDGLVEARRGSDLFGSERACEVLAAEWRSAIQLRVRRLIRAARRHENEQLRDDVVVLAVERPAFPEDRPTGGPG